MSQSQEEVQEVMQALEELAISYDNKDIEIQTLNKENMALLTMNESLRVSVISWVCHMWVWFVYRSV